MIQTDNLSLEKQFKNSEKPMYLYIEKNKDIRSKELILYNLQSNKETIVSFNYDFSGIMIISKNILGVKYEIKNKNFTYDTGLINLEKKTYSESSSNANVYTSWDWMYPSSKRFLTVYGFGNSDKEIYLNIISPVEDIILKQYIIEKKDMNIQYFHIEGSYEENKAVYVSDGILREINLDSKTSNVLHIFSKKDIRNISPLSPDRQYFAYNRFGEPFKLYLLNLKTGEENEIISNHGNAYREVGRSFYWTLNSKYLIFNSGIPDFIIPFPPLRSDSAIYAYSIDTKELKRIYPKHRINFSYFRFSEEPLITDDVLSGNTQIRISPDFETPDMTIINYKDDMKTFMKQYNLGK